MSAVKINHLWWNHLLPTALIPKHQEVGELLNRFIYGTAYGAIWHTQARNANGVLRLKAGQIIPSIHIVFLGDSPGFIAPLQNLKESHRSTSSMTEYESGNPLAENEVAIKPEIRIEIATDPVFIDSAKNGITKIREELITIPSQIFSISANLLLYPPAYQSNVYILYQHIFGNGSSYPYDGYFYVGVTTRSWKKRWAEHQAAIRGDSHLLFHRKFREEEANNRLTYIHHKIMGITTNLEELYKAEEFLVESHWNDERRLNMIPGGKSGLRYLRENGLISKNDIPQPDERDSIVRSWLDSHPRIGLPAPWVSEKWRDNAWAVAQICGRSNRLSVEQVRAIRELADEFSIEDICARIGAKNVTQVKRVLSGQTYVRVS